MRRNSTWNPHRLESSSSLTDSLVSMGMVFWKGTERLSNRVDYPHTQNGIQEECTNYWDIYLLRLSGIVYFKSLKRWHEIIEPKLDDTQCGFRPGGSTTDHIFEKSWKYVKDVYICFFYLAKSYDRFPHEKLLEICRSKVLTVTGYLPLSHSFPACFLCRGS